MHEQVLKRILQQSEIDAVIPGSTPVISFGDFTKAKVATLGINPSSREFVNKAGLLKKKRLTDFQTLGIQIDEVLAESHAEKIMEGCNQYFHEKANPLWSWFGKNELILKGLNASYLDGSACHLDLVQDATKPAWSEISSSDKARVLQKDYWFFEWQVKNTSAEILLLGGRQVHDQVKTLPNVEIHYINNISYSNGENKQTSQLFVVPTLAGKLALGWTLNIQQLRVSKEEKNRVAHELAEFVKKNS
ncbi:MAG: hypothetical protein RLZZ330_448 [Actinomycetota bacterium]|jgi:hypothetical protein